MMNRPARMDPAEFARVSGVSRETLARLERYAQLLEKWQRAINLVSAASLQDLWGRHMWDSAQLRPLLPERTRVLVDMGSGAGFPGMVLAILGVPEVHLVESDQRKCAFLREVSRETDTSVTVRACRIETLERFPADAITARALAPLDRLVTLAAPFMADRTVCLFLKGQDAGKELTAATEVATMRVDSLPSRSGSGGIILRIERIGRA